MAIHTSDKAGKDKAGAGRVVVGTDGSDQAARAIDWAAAYASRNGAGLTLVQVAPPMPIPSRAGVYAAMAQGNDFYQRISEDLHAGLEASTDKLRKAYPGLDVDYSIREGHPADVLSGETKHADCVVLGATGVSGLASLLGGTATAVVHHAHGRVVVVPATDGNPDGPVGVGLDGSRASSKVAEAAIAEAVGLGRSLLAVHVWEIDPALDTDWAISLYDSEQAIRADADKLLAELTADAPDDLQVDRRVELGRPKEVLSQISSDCSMLVVGSRGFGGFKAALMGSVSRAVISHAKCPVMVVRD